ncbi:MAG: hypothetical protein KO206_01690 [Methanomicrobiaceae archaeon]|nr:hypothetical protein [Methanomicrobiaceae archaeon]
MVRGIAIATCDYIESDERQPVGISVPASSKYLIDGILVQTTCPSGELTLDIGIIFICAIEKIITGASETP